MEGVETRVGLAPAAIGKTEIGIAEHADEADLYDVERPRQHVGLLVEARHALPGAIPVIVAPGLPLQSLRPYHFFVAAQQHRIEHALQQGMSAFYFPSRRAGS